jgi:uroporphyrinogen decarboxylase
MNGRERELAAIRHEIPDRIPTDAIAVENQAAIAAHLGIDEQAVLPRLGLDGRIVSAGYVGEMPEPRDGSRLPAGVPLSEWGTPNTGDYGTARTYPLAHAQSVAEIERYPWPDVAAYDYEGAAAVARALDAEYAVRGPYWRPLFCQVCDLVGMEQAMILMALEPTLFEAILEMVYSQTLAFCERLLAACGPAMPILCLGDDFATQRGMMISPEQWRRFLKPRFARLFALGKEAGKFVWFHSCGDITAILPDLIDIGMDVWETVQLHALPVSPEWLKREYGRHLTFFGAVSTQRLPFVGAADVRAEVRARIEVLGEGGGYICGPDHHIKPDVSVENTLALFDTARAFRREGYTSL